MRLRRLMSLLLVVFLLFLSSCQKTPGHPGELGNDGAQSQTSSQVMNPSPYGSADVSALTVNGRLTVYFLRHGKSDYTVSTNATAHLNETGYQQAECIARYFQKVGTVDIVFTSPYQRCVDTVEPFCALSGLTPVVVPEIYERTISTEVEKIPAGFADAQWKDFTYKLKGGESLEEVEKRMISGLAAVFDCADEKKADTVIVSSHAMALSTLLNVYLPGQGAEIYSRILSMNTPCVRCVFEGASCVEMEFINISD